MTPEDAILFNEANRLGEALWARSLQIEGLNNDPKMVSIMLFRRLWSHHRGYAVLHNAHLSLEADIILRSSIEAAICIAANYRLPGGLWVKLQQDALHTLTNQQIKHFRDMGDKEMEREAEATRRWLQNRLPPGFKGEKLDMKVLAETGNVAMLYGFYRGLSGTSSHVTGLSILRGVVSGDDTTLQDEWTAVSQKTRHLWQIATTLQASLFHSVLIGENSYAETAIALAERLNERLAVAGF